MATTYKILGQKAPAATTETDLYTVPASTETVVSSIVVANRSASADSFRLSVSEGGGATATTDYLAYDFTLDGNDVYVATIGITLSATDKVRCYSTNGDLTFNIFGSEIA